MQAELSNHLPFSSFWPQIRLVLVPEVSPSFVTLLTYQFPNLSVCFNCGHTGHPGSDDSDVDML